MKKAIAIRIGGAVLALAAVSAVGGGAASASSEQQLRGLDALIKIKGGGDNLRFVGPETAQQGAQLQIDNLTDPNADGPHTFSLVTKGAMPEGNEERKKCGKLELKVCERIGEAHDAFTGPPFISSADHGLAGWDRPFDKQTDGDSYLFESEDESHSRNVPADPGKLRYFCIVHPFMKGKIEVVP